MTNWEAWRDLPWRSKVTIVLGAFPLVYAWLVTKGMQKKV